VVGGATVTDKPWYTLYDDESESFMAKQDNTPEFNDPEEALDWMEARLNKSWVDDINPAPKAPVEPTETAENVGPESVYTKGSDVPDLTLDDFMKMMMGHEGDPGDQ
jgi:hypothetical protein